MELGMLALIVAANMIVLVSVGLAMGKRQLGEFTPLDFAASITSGTVAGAAIADPHIELWRSVMALILLGGFQFSLSWISLKYPSVHALLSHSPTVLVENGQIIKTNLKKCA